MSRRVRAVGGLSAFVPLAWLGVEEFRGPEKLGNRRNARLVGQIATVGAAAAVAGLQSKRFKLFTMSGGEPGKLALVAIGAVVVSWALQIGLVAAAFALLT